MIDGEEITNSRSTLSGSESDKKQKDLVGIFADIGRGVRKIFRPSRENTTKTKMTDTSHGLFTFAMVYANEQAQTVIEKDLLYFPAGSIIVREKLETAISDAPQSVIAMVKRERGFSKETDDWEFFALDAKDLQLKRRETKGDCATCHVQAQKDDWVFRDYLK